MTFDAFRLDEPILRAVRARGYHNPTPIQSQAIPHLMAGRDLLGCAQTGTGKTAAFALPILHRLMQAGPQPNGHGRPIRVLVLAPTRELALQIDESFEAYGCQTGTRHTVVFGGVSQLSQTRALRQGVDILVATPGRLLDLMGQGFVDLRSIGTFVLDEADRMLDMGFLPDVRRIVAELPTRRQTILFSATIPEPAERLAAAVLRDPVRIRVAPVRATTELITQSVFFVARPQKLRLLSRLLLGQAMTRALVFTRTKHGADRVARQLRKSGIRADAIHGNKSQNARQRTLADFRDQRTPVLVATDIAARGIDVEGISHVVNYDLPHEPETYVHRIGRTGRAGAAGTAFSFCDDDERQHLKAIERLIRRPLPVESAPECGDNRPSKARPQDQRRVVSVLGRSGRKRKQVARAGEASRTPRPAHGASGGRRPVKSGGRARKPGPRRAL